MSFAIVGEGITDFKVLKNLLIGFFNDKSLTVNQLHPKLKEPGGWGNLRDYLGGEEFRISFEFNDYVVIQIDTKECADWDEGIANIGDKAEKIEVFIEQIKQVLISKIGEEFYTQHQQNIFFAITVHEIECWLMPFVSTRKLDQEKMVSCFTTLKKIAPKILKKGEYLDQNQKNYQGGKHYETFSSDMKKQKELLKKSDLNPSLKIFVETLKQSFPA